MASFGIDFGTTNTSVVECLVTEHGMTRTPYGENNQPESAAIVLEQSANDWEIAQIQKLLLKLPQEKLKMWRQMLEIYIATETKRD